MNIKSLKNQVEERGTVDIGLSYSCYDDPDYFNVSIEFPDWVSELCGLDKNFQIECYMHTKSFEIENGYVSDITDLEYAVCDELNSYIQFATDCYKENLMYLKTLFDDIDDFVNWLAPVCVYDAFSDKREFVYDDSDRIIELDCVVSTDEDGTSQVDVHFPEWTGQEYMTFVGNIDLDNTTDLCFDIAMHLNIDARSEQSILFKKLLEKLADVISDENVEFNFTEV